MGALLLLVDVPEQRPPGPLGTDEGILAAHCVEIAAPENPVVVILADERQDLDRQVSTTQACTHAQLFLPQPGRQVRQYATDRHQQLHGPLTGRQDVEPAGKGSVLVGEERNEQGVRFQLHPQLLEEGPARLWIGLEGLATLHQGVFPQ
ncbi:hypothetical protein D9M72_370790 [compost metagenome]